MTNTWTGGWDELRGAFDTATGGLNRGLSSLAKGHGLDIFGIDPADRGDSSSSDSSSKPADTSESKGKTSKPATTSTTPATTPPESTWEQLANAQANQYLAATSNLAPLTSGTKISNIDSQMASGAEAMLGQSGGGAMDAWLKQQGSAAAAQYAPLQAAVGQEETAEQNAEKLEAGGIKNMGQAEANMIQMAPYQQLLSSLAADVPYKLLGGAYGSYDIPGILGKTVPSGVETALSNLGVSTQGLTNNGVPTLPPVAGSQQSATPTPESTTQSLTQ